MPIPDSLDFNALLGSLTLTQPQQGNYRQIEAVAARALSDESSLSTSKPIPLWIPTGMTVTPDGLVERLRKELEQCHHVSSAEMAILVLAMYCLTSPAVQSPAARLNAIVSMIRPAQSTQYLITPFPPHPELRPWQIGRFTLGPINREQIEYWCRRVGCDFFDRYPGRFSGRFAIYGAPVEVSVLSWPDVRETYAISPSSTGTTIVDYYFEMLTRHLRRDFQAEFTRSEELYVAAGAPYIDLNDYRVWAGGSFVSIFQGIGKKNGGYFCPFGTGMGIDYARADRRFPQLVNKLRDSFGFSGYDNSETHKMLSTYARFLASAKAHQADDRWDEAFLHHIIALDLLLGERDESVQTVSRRTALLLSRGDPDEFARYRRKLKDIYDKRSRYVHAGEAIEEKELAVVGHITTEVLFTLLRLQASPGSKSAGFVGAWLKTLDYFVAAIGAGRKLDHQALLEAGVRLQTSPEDSF